MILLFLRMKIMIWSDGKYDMITIDLPFPEGVYIESQ